MLRLQQRIWSVSLEQTTLRTNLKCLLTLRESPDQMRRTGRRRPRKLLCFQLDSRDQSCIQSRPVNCYMCPHHFEHKRPPPAYPSMCRLCMGDTSPIPTKNMSQGHTQSTMRILRQKKCHSGICCIWWSQCLQRICQPGKDDSLILHQQGIPLDMLMWWSQ